MNSACEKIQDQLADCILGIVSAEEMNAVGEHIGRCPKCRQYLQSLENENRLLAQFGENLEATMTGRQDRVIEALSRSTPTMHKKASSIWSVIMKSRITQLAAAAALIIISAVGIYHFTGTKLAYGVPEALNLYKKAGTIHIQGRSFYPELVGPNETQHAVGFEVWLDISNGRARVRNAGRMTKDGQTTFNYFEQVMDGQYRMKIHHTDKCVTYYKLDQADRRRLVTENLDSQLKQIFGEPDKIEDYVLIGVEQIGDTVFDIWQAEVLSDPDSQIWVRIKMWLSPASGEIGRVITWRGKAEAEWTPAYQIDKIGRDVVFPEGLFKTEPPEGYVATNRKETVEEPTLSKSSWYGKNAAIGVYNGFTLGDGSVIIPFSSASRKSDVSWAPGDESADVWQIEVFENLQSGGPLPELPIVVSALKRKSLWGNGTIYIGRHLAYTQKDDKLYEWAIYVPPRKVKAQRSAFAFGYKAYEAVLEFSPEELATGWDYKVVLYPSRAVDAGNFDTLLLKYISDFSDDGTVPGNLTYEGILQLARHIRNSLVE
jgi:hypothetical protein